MPTCDWLRGSFIPAFNFFSATSVYYFLSFLCCIPSPLFLAFSYLTFSSFLPRIHKPGTNVPPSLSTYSTGISFLSISPVDCPRTRYHNLRFPPLQTGLLPPHVLLKDARFVEAPVHVESGP
jgi:hypothetical protein